MHFQSQIIIRNNSGAALSAETMTSLISNGIKIRLARFNHLEIRLEEGKSSIGIKEIESLKEWAYKKSDDIKFAVIYEAELMTREAQNSILKVLEEPSENTLIILVTKNEHLLLATIRSRCKATRVDQTQYPKEVEEFAHRYVNWQNSIPSSKEFQKEIDNLPTKNLQEIIEAIRREVVSQFQVEENLTGLENMIELLEILELAIQNNAGNKVITSTLHTFLAKQNI